MTEKKILHYLELFLTKNETIFQLKNVVEIYPYWQLFLVTILKENFPSEWPLYQNHINLENRQIGDILHDFPNITNFLLTVNFPYVVWILLNKIKIKDTNTFACSINPDRHNHCLEYFLVGSVLWPSTDVYITWNISSSTDLNYQVQLD
jgi:hypothetical protein